MSGDFGCPFVAGPACADCDGSCWQPEILHTQPQPEPCEGCYYVTGRMQVHDGTCDGLTAENVEAMRAAYKRMADTLADTPPATG